MHIDTSFYPEKALACLLESKLAAAVKVTV